MKFPVVITTTLVLLAVACGPPAPVETADAGEVDTGGPDAEPAPDSGPDGEVSRCDAGSEVAERGELELTGTGECDFELVFPAAVLTEVTGSSDTQLRIDDVSGDEPNWFSPGLLDGGTHLLHVSGGDNWSITVSTYGTPVAAIDRDRSLVWTDPAIVDDAETVGLQKLMNIASGEDDPGLLFADWLRRFSTTAHSERLGPLQLLEEIEETYGTDPTQWDLDALEFTVTGVHNRVDLAADEACGELRVSVASTHQVYQPFHAIFLFEQVPTEGDVSPGGEVHCGETLRRWARLSELGEDEFHQQARELLADGLRPERFLMIETVEFIVSPWEWRQWLPTTNDDPESELERVFVNPPLFQTVDIAGLNQPGARRDDFLAFVEENASELDAREAMLPKRFRPRSARVNAGVPWVPLDLEGIDPTVVDDFPELRQNIEMMGCPACHATDADFIQTRPDRSFSPFYDKELDARASHLSRAHQGEAFDVPFGPLQESPVLPP